MKLLLDENLSRRLVPFLQAEFPDSTQVVLAGLERATDMAIWAHARDRGYVIVTRDADFEELSTIHGCPPRVIWIRGENMSKTAILNLLLANRDVIEDALSEDGIACVELGSNIGRRESPQAPDSSQRGFTLIELAIVMFIVSLLIGGMLLPLSAQQDIRARQETERILANARDALLGFTILNERLPCPATANSAGRETFCSTQTYPCTGVEEYAYNSATNNGYCFGYYGNFLPAVTLGIQPTDANGFAVDGWGANATNRLRYAVSTNSLRNFGTILPTPFVLTRTQGMKGATLKPDVSVCTSGAQVINPGTSIAETSAGQNNYARCAAGGALIEDAMAVIYSLGKNSGTDGSEADETHNPNPQATIVVDPAFVSATPGPTFDDHMIWISTNILFNRMVSAGKLP
jgi:prepilin-type N-terminal cleavage/methylation domain-containing protein